MSAMHDNEWQTMKTVLECNRYMLDNEIETDVCFEFPSEAGSTVYIRAHKYMLISRSPVLWTMQCGEFAKSVGAETKINVTDIHPDVFKEMLRFIYYDKAEVTFESAQSMLYAAEKYYLPRLSELCTKVLEDSLDVSNVCCILDLSLMYNDGNLREACLNFIADNSGIVLGSDTFVEISSTALESVLKIERIKSSESTIYRSCIAWAKRQLKRKKAIENPTNEKIRQALGNMFNEIRFPTMEVTEFAVLVGKSDILSSDELSRIYYHIATRQATGDIGFPTRNRQEFVLSRFTRSWNSVCESNCSSCNSKLPALNAVNVTVDKDIMLTGLGVYTGYNSIDYEMEIKLYLCRFSKPIYCLKVTVPGARKASIVYHVLFDKPVKLSRDNVYHIVTLSNGTIGYRGETNEPNVEKAGVMFKFSKYSGPLKFNMTTELNGQLPQLHFMLTR